MSDSDIEVMITTYDNPYDPFLEFEAWFKEDCRLHYNTSSLLARIANTVNVQSEEINDKDVEDAIDYIVDAFPLIYKKIYKNGDSPVEDKNKNIEGGSPENAPPVQSGGS